MRDQHLFSWGGGGWGGVGGLEDLGFGRGSDSFQGKNCQ